MADKLVRTVMICLLAGTTGFGQGTRDSSVSLLFAGDVTLASHFERYVGDSMAYAFGKLKWFADADITMINLENPLTTRGTAVEKKYTFRAKPQYAGMLREAGIDIVTLANNHIYDFGPEGLQDTIDRLLAENIYYIGAGRHINEARHPVIFFISGLRIAYFAYYGTHRHSDSYPAQDDSAGTAPRQLPIIKEDIEKYREQADYIIVNFHWGIEKAEYPGADQQMFARQVIDYGADIIVGHHPHVLQGIEKYKNGIIAYSLGNFIFGGNSRITYDTAVLKIELAKEQQIKVSLIPITVNYWQPSILSGEKGRELIKYIMKISGKFGNSIF